jgi:hypothetical protein
VLPGYREVIGEVDIVKNQDQEGYRFLWEMLQCPVRDTVRARSLADLETLSLTSMFTAQISSLGGNKLVPSRTFCPRAVAQGLKKKKKVNGRGVDVTSFLEFSFCGERTHSDISFRGEDLDFGEASGQPNEV